PDMWYGGSFTYRRSAMYKTPFMYYPATGALRRTLRFPFLPVPMAIWLLINWISEWQIATATIGIIGVLGLLTKNLLMKKIVVAYKTRKYEMIAGFKEQEN